MLSYSAIDKNNVAVVTGAASGIGLASARRFASLGMRSCSRISAVRSCRQRQPR